MDKQKSQNNRDIKILMQELILKDKKFTAGVIKFSFLQFYSFMFEKCHFPLHSLEKRRVPTLAIQSSTILCVQFSNQFITVSLILQSLS